MKWKKANGSVVETNDAPATVAAAESLGWKRVRRVTKKKTAKKK